MLEPVSHLLGSSITYRVAIGPQQGRKLFTLQTLPDCEAENPLCAFAPKFEPKTIYICTLNCPGYNGQTA
jgi:hypothetical protein